MSQPEPDPDLNKPRLVVGIGASAGGLDAFKAFFSSMPDDSGLAFVLLPHLDPGHQSMMVELLTKQTRIPVCEARGGQRVEANHIYILPPGKNLTISASKLHLSTVKEPRQVWTAIDRFLRSLAKDQEERAVGVILSGTGSHGTLGLKEIKLFGGIVIAQDPETASYSQMPFSAIATGLVDLVLPPAEMPAALLEYGKHPYVVQASSGQDAGHEEINRILTVLRTRTKYDFRCYRRNMLMRRIQRRMGLCHVDNLASYYQLLRDKPDEVMALYRDLLIGVTAFFREPEAFHILEQRVFPDLIARCSEDSQVRIWVPACATGEEAYTLAMLLLESFEGTGTLPNLQIFATDIDEASLEVARRGVYPESIAADVSSKRLRRFFVKSGDTFRVNQQLRDTIVFAVQNLISDVPFSRLDLISCRNLLIYLQPELQSKVIQLFHFSLKEEGYLLLGPSESVGRQTDLFEALSRKWRVFRRIGPTRRDMVNIPITGTTVPRVAAERDAARLKPLLRSAERYAALTEQYLLAEYAPASVLINQTYEILHFYGPTVNYLELPSGEPTRNLLAMIREGLRTHLRAAVHRAVQKKQTVVDNGARVKRNGRQFHCSITARPLNKGRESEGLVLISFEDIPEKTTARPQLAVDTSTVPSVGEDTVVQQLEYELDTTREDLQNTIDELETSNEELKASNEEVMSMNEELQSANEELESSKEELQSMNEELNTVNTQLQSKLEELEKSQDDVRNLLASTDIATIFLDRDMHIQLFNPPTAKLLSLRPGDIGRPISDFSAKVTNSDLLSDAREVLDTLIPVEKDVWSSDESPQKRCYLRRIVPYRAGGSRIGGVVITFVDITQHHRAKEQLEARVAERTRELYDREKHLQTIVNSVGDAIVIVGRDGLIQSMNPAGEQIFGYSAGELIGQNVSRLMPSPYRNEHDHYIARYLQTGKITILGKRRELPGCRKDGSTVSLEVVVTEVDQLGLFAGVIRDISRKRELEREVANASTVEQERIGREIHDGIGQQLTGLSMLAVSLRNELAAAGFDENKKLEDMIEQLKVLIGATRNLSHGLNPISVGPLGLTDALKKLATQINDTTEIRCELIDGHPDIGLTDSRDATQVYRIVQEAVNNALKHAKAHRITIKLDVTEKHIEVIVRDDGRGFDTASIPDQSGFGLRIMRYRAGILDGQLMIDSAPGKGTRVCLRLPHQA